MPRIFVVVVLIGIPPPKSPFPQKLQLKKIQIDKHIPEDRSKQKFCWLRKLTDKQQKNNIRLRLRHTKNIYIIDET